MASNNNNDSSTVEIVWRAAAPRPTSAAADLMAHIPAMEEKYEHKSTLTMHAGAGIRMAIENFKSCIEVEAADDGGMVVKVESSYEYRRLRPLPSMEIEIDEMGPANVKVKPEAVEDEIAETNEMGPANVKVKLD